MKAKDRVVGILGGKGPEATDLLFQLIIRNTPVRVEEEHLRIIIDNNPKIPKPSLGITGEGENPIPALVNTAKNLEKAGADFIIIACNSAHYYIEDIQKAIEIPILSIIEETVAYVQNLSHKKVGILASTGLIKSDLYQSAFKKAGIFVLCPSDGEQDELMEGIINFKDSGSGRTLKDAADKICRGYIEKGAEALVIACTDIPVVLNIKEFTVPCYDSLEILALATVRKAKTAVR